MGGVKSHATSLLATLYKNIPNANQFKRNKKGKIVTGEMDSLFLKLREKNISEKELAVATWKVCMQQSKLYKNVSISSNLPPLCKNESGAENQGPVKRGLIYES